MTATSKAEGSVTADGTEQTIHSNTDDGTYVLYLDLVNMALIDKLIIRAYIKVRSTGALQRIILGSYQHAQTGEPTAVSIPLASVREIKFTLEQTAGTNRAYPFEVVAL